MNKSIKWQLLNGTAWSGIGRIVSAGTNFAANIILANSLSPHEYGLYFIANVTIIIISGVGTMGMDQVVIRLIASYDFSGPIQKHIYRRCLAMVAFAIIPVSIIFLFLSPYLFSDLLHANGLISLGLILAIWLMVATMQRQLAETFRGFGDIRSATLFGGVRNCGIIYSASLCLTFVMLVHLKVMSLRSSVIASAGVSLFVVIIAGIWLLLHERKFLNTNKEACTTSQPVLDYRLLIREGWPLWMAMLIMVLGNMGAPWIASIVDVPGKVALYGIAQRFMVLLVAPLTIVNAVMPPIFARLFAQRKFSYLESVVRSVSGMLILPTGLLFLIMFFFGRDILVILFGEYYRSSYPILIILCAAQVINIATGSWQLLLPMAGKRHNSLHTSLIAAFSQLGLAFLLGSNYGIVGVAAGYALGVLITNIIGVLITYRSCDILTIANMSPRMFKQVLDESFVDQRHKLNKAAKKKYD